jgi:hypothetical protein
MDLTKFSSSLGAPICTFGALLLDNLPGLKGLLVHPSPLLFRRSLLAIEKLMHVGKFKKFTAYNQHTNKSAYMRITKSETITERTQVYPGKPSWGRKPSQNFSLDSSTKYSTSTRL